MYVQYVLTLFSLFLFQMLPFTDESHESHNNPQSLPQLVHDIQYDVGSSIQLQCNMSSVESKLLVWWLNEKTVYNGHDGSLDERFSVFIEPKWQTLMINNARANYDGLYRAETVDGVELIRYRLSINRPGSSHSTSSVLSHTTVTHKSSSTIQPSQHQQQQEGSSNQSTMPTYAVYGVYYVCVASTVCTAIATYFFAAHMSRKKNRYHTEQETLLEKEKPYRSVTETTISQPVDIDGAMEPDNEMSLHGEEPTGVIAER